MYTTSTKIKPKNLKPLPDEPERQTQAKPVEETKKVPLFEGNTSKQIIISALLDEKIESELIHFLRDNNDIFAWSAEDFPGWTDPSLNTT